MAPTLEANVQALERELIKYEEGIPELLEVDDVLYAMFEKTESDPASNRPTRVPLLTAIQGNFQQANMDNADLGNTSGPAWQVATLVPIYFTHGVGLSQLSLYAATGAERAVKNPLQETIKATLAQFRAALDMLTHTPGTGVLGTITTLPGGNVFTMTTDGFKVQLFYVGMPIQVYDTTLTTNRGSTTVTAVDRINFQITCSSTPGGTVVTDKVVIAGLSGALTAQSSLFGLQYHQSNASSGLWLNLNRATFPQIRTPAVSAGGSQLTTAPIRRALNFIRENLGVKALSKRKVLAILHPVQADAYESLAVQISQIWKEPTGNQKVDLMFDAENDEGLRMSGKPVHQSIHQDRTRIDFICPETWGRIVGTDTGFYKVGDNYLFPQYRSGGDGLFSSFFFYYKAGLQIYNRNPLCGSYISNLLVLANY